MYNTTLQCITLQCCTAQCSAAQCSAVLHSAVQCSTAQCSAAQCSAVQGVSTPWWPVSRFVHFHPGGFYWSYHNTLLQTPTAQISYTTLLHRLVLFTALCSYRGFNPCRSVPNFFLADNCICYQGRYNEHSHAKGQHKKRLIA